MTKEEFVAVVRTEVLESAASESIEMYEEGPPGHSPHESDVRLSKWYKSLSVADQDMVRNVALDVSHGAVFGLFCVLDGVRVVEDGPVKGDFFLTYRKGDVEVQLTSDDDCNFLHDILNAE